MESIEAQCLSALMKSPADAYAAASDGLTPAHFLDNRLRAVFQAILGAAAEAKDTSAYAVAVQLRTSTEGPAVSIADLCAIDNLQPTSASRAALVQAVLDADRRRKLTASLASALDAAKEERGSFGELWESVAPHVEAAQSVTVASRTRPISEMATSLIQQIEHPDERRVVSSGFVSWDRHATPLRAGEMVTIAARPGCGKTAMGVQIAVNVAASGYRVAFFSLEMSGEELVGRIARLRGGRKTLLDDRAYLDAIREAGKLKTLHVFDNGERHTMASIEARARLLSTISGGLSLVVVDYLQLVDPSDRRMPREQQVAEMSRRLKQLAGSIHCPVIVLAQLNREIEKDTRRPRLSDLRESGAIEQDSDRVWFLWQDPNTVIPGNEEAAAIEVQLIQAKCRGGPPHICTRMRFDRPLFQFAQLTAER